MIQQGGVQGDLGVRERLGLPAGVRCHAPCPHPPIHPHQRHRLSQHTCHCRRGNNHHQIAHRCHGDGPQSSSHLQEHKCQHIYMQIIHV